MHLIRPLAWFLAAFVALAGCKGSNEGTTPQAGQPGESVSVPPPQESASLADPKASMAYQLELLKAGEVEKLKTCFTERQREQITAQAVAKGKEEAAKATLDELVASVELGEDEGKKTAKIKMKNGRTLTTLIQTEGQWLSDTVWFN